MGRTFQEIADEIYLTWSGDSSHLTNASIYLEELQKFNTTDPEATVGGQSAKELVLGFLSTSAPFKGRNSSRLKCELRDAAGIKFNVYKNKYQL